MPRPPSSVPALLAIDTATDVLAVGLVAPAGRWCVDEPGGQAASARLVPLVNELMAGAGLHFSQLQALAYGRGPGAFTGLRTACAAAQGLAFGAGCPVLALDSLLVVAEACRGETEAVELWVAMDARMDEVYAGRYRHDGTRWHTVTAPALYTLEALNAHWLRQPPAVLAGTARGPPHPGGGRPPTAVPAFEGRLHWGPAAVRQAGGTRADALLRLAEAAWTQGEARLDAAQALPLYLRDKVALTTAEREAARQGAAAAAP
jgi:tRNA threonylcarbamoyladenosine biosynthesis protein TsaB